MDVQFAFSFELVACFLLRSPPFFVVLVNSIWVWLPHWFYQCDGEWWFRLSALPWVTVRCSSLSKAPFPSSSVSMSLNYNTVEPPRTATSPQRPHLFNGHVFLSRLLVHSLKSSYGKPSHNGYLFTTGRKFGLKVAVVERFDCKKGTEMVILLCSGQFRAKIFA